MRGLRKSCSPLDEGVELGVELGAELGAHVELGTVLLEESGKS